VENDFYIGQGQMKRKYRETYILKKATLNLFKNSFHSQFKHREYRNRQLAKKHVANEWKARLTYSAMYEKSMP